MTNEKPPFRADHVGSLLRPPELLRAREQHQQGTLSAEGLREIEDRCIRDVVKLQEDIGLQGGFFSEFRGRGPRLEKAGEPESGSRQALRTGSQT